MPSGREIHLDAALTSFAIACKPEGFIADQIAPIVPVANMSDKYYIWGTEDLKLIDTVRAAKTESKGVHRTISSTTFQCVGHSLHEDIDDLDRNAARGWDPAAVATQGLINRILMAKEAELISLITTYTNYSSSSFYTTLVGGDQWDSLGGTSDVLGQIQTAVAAVKAGCGVAPNTIILPWSVAIKLSNHPQLVDARRGVNMDTWLMGNLPPTLGGLKVLIAGAQKDTTREGQTGQTFSGLMSDYVVVCYINPSTNFMEEAWVKQFVFSGQTPYTVERIPLPLLGNNAERVELNQTGRCFKMTMNTAAYLFIDVLK